MKELVLKEIEKAPEKYLAKVLKPLHRTVALAILLLAEKAKRWKRLSSQKKYAYIVGELLGVAFGVVFGYGLGWVNGRITQSIYIGFVFGATVFGPAFAKRLAQRCTSRT